MNLQKRIEISLCISGNKIPFDTISDRLKITPTSIKTQTNLSSSLSEELKKDEWCYSIDLTPCLALSDAFEKLISIFDNKKKDILDICNKYNANVNILIITDMINDELPELIIPLSAISFSNEIKSEICFDIYSY